MVMIERSCEMKSDLNHISIVIEHGQSAKWKHNPLWSKKLQFRLQIIEFDAPELGISKF